MKKAKISIICRASVEAPTTTRHSTHVLKELALAANVDKLGEADLGDNGTELAGGSRDTVGGGTVTGREGLAGNDEGCGCGESVLWTLEYQLLLTVRAKVLEEVGHAVEEDEGLLSRRGRLHLVVGEAHADENGSEKTEAHELDGTTSPRVDQGNGEVVTGEETAERENNVTDSSVVKGLVHVDLGRLVGVLVGAKADGGKDLGRVETETVESNVKGEPGVGSTKENLAVLPLGEVADEVGPGGLGEFGALVVANGVNNVGTGGEVRVDVLRGLLDVALNVHSVTGSLGDSETEVEGNASGDTADTDKSTPALVNGLEVVNGLRKNALLETSNGNNGDDSAGKVTPALSGEDGSHHTATVAAGSELGGDDGRKGVVTTDSHSHDKAPHDNDAVDRDTGGMTSNDLTNGADWNV